MASGRLGSHLAVAGAGVYNVYEVPVGKTAEVNINVLNNAAVPAKVTLFRSPTGTPSATHTIQLDTLDASESYQRTALVLKAGEFISYRTDVNGVSVVVSGNEYTSLANEIVTQTLIMANGNTVVYDNTVAKDSTVNISVCLVDGSAVSDTSTVLFSTTTPTVCPMYKTVLSTTGDTGFEYTGLPISAANKLRITCGGLVGQVAVTVSGYTRG